MLLTGHGRRSAMPSLSQRLASRTPAPPVQRLQQMIHRPAVSNAQPRPEGLRANEQKVSQSGPMPRSDCEQTSKGRSGDFARFARFARNHFPAGPGRPGTLLVCSQGHDGKSLATTSRGWPAVAGRANAMLQQTGWRDALFVEAQPITSRATAWNSFRQSDCCCKTENRTILGERVRGWTVAGPVQWLWLVAFFYATAGYSRTGTEPGDWDFRTRRQRAKTRHGHH